MLCTKIGIFVHKITDTVVFLAASCVINCYKLLKMQISTFLLGFGSNTNLAEMC